LHALCLQEVQLPPVEGDPFAAAKAAKYSMSSIPSSARKQLSRSSSAPNKPNQGGSSSPSVGQTTAGQTAAQLGAAGVAAAAAAGLRSGCSRSASDTAALMRSPSAAAAAAAMFQQQEAVRMGACPEAGSSAFAAVAACRGNPHRLSMDSAGWSNYAAVHQDLRTKRRHSVDAVAAARAAMNSGSTHNSGSYASASKSCSILPTMQMALQPQQMVQLPPRPPAGWEMMSPLQQGSSSNNNSGLLPGVNMAACGSNMGAASPGGSWILQQQQQQHMMMSPQQLQLMQLHLQQQHSGCMTDVSGGSRPFDVSNASLASANSMGSMQRQASLMRQFSMESAGSSSNQLPHIVLQQQQDAALDAAAGGIAACEQQLHLPLQLVSPDGLSLNPGGPYIAGRSGSSGRIPTAGQPAGTDSPAAAAAGMPGTRLSVVPEGAAAAAAGVRPGSGGGSGTSVPIFRDGSSSSSTNSSLSCPYAPSNALSPGCTSLASPDGWSPAVGLAAAASASPGVPYQTSQLPVQQQQQYVTGSPAVASAHLEALGAQLQQMQLNAESQASMNDLLTSVSAQAAQAEMMRQQAALAQAAANAANDRLVAYIAALGSNSAKSLAAMGAAAANAAACSSVYPNVGVAASPHAEQIMVQQQQQQTRAQQQQQQMLQSDQLMILLDDQTAAAGGGGPMLVTQGSAGMQQQYVLHGTPQASAESLMGHPTIPSTTWM
jgi:hypothetical protein